MDLHGPFCTTAGDVREMDHAIIIYELIDIGVCSRDDSYQQQNAYRYGPWINAYHLCHTCRVK
jgi:hypothetical protein